MAARSTALGSIAKSGTGLTVWCDDDARPHLREPLPRPTAPTRSAILISFAQSDPYFLSEPEKRSAE
jgi:hypothetical protein